MVELFIYKKEGSRPIEISERQFELIDRTNAKETTVIRSKYDIRTNTAVFKDGKIVNIKRGHLYKALDDGFFADEHGWSLDVEDIPEIKAYCPERFFGSDQFFTIVIVERLDQPSTSRERKKTRESLRCFTTGEIREMLMIISSSKGSVEEQEIVITDTPMEAFKLGRKFMGDNMSKLQDGEVIEIEVVDVKSDKTMMHWNSGSEVHKKQ